MTIDQYASKWAALDHEAITKTPEYLAPSRQEIFFQWAVADPDSPISKAIAEGESEDSVKEKFDTAYEQMLGILSRFDGQPSSK